jgi:hypothetical protein
MTDDEFKLKRDEEAEVDLKRDIMPEETQDRFARGADWARAEMQAEIERVRAELAAEREHIEGLQRQLGFVLSKQVPALIEMRDAYREQAEKLAEALDHYSKLEDWDMLPVIARAALASYQKFKENK